jgi:hypothetical protein
MTAALDLEFDPKSFHSDAPRALHRPRAAITTVKVHSWM